MWGSMKRNWTWSLPTLTPIVMAESKWMKLWWLLEIWVYLFHRLKPCSFSNGNLLLTWLSFEQNWSSKFFYRIDKDKTLEISFDEWRDYFLFHPTTDMREIIQYWRHSTVSINSWCLIDWRSPDFSVPGNNWFTTSLLPVAFLLN